MKKHRITLSISAFVLSIIALSSALFNLAHAEGSEVKPAVWLQVSPTSQSLTLNPGDQYDGEFNVTNIGSEEFIFKVYASPFSVVGETYDHDYMSEKSYNQISRWVTFDTPEYTLPAGDDDNAKQVVKFHVNVPADAPSGSQHAVLFAESSGSTTASSEEGIKAVSRVGMRLGAQISGETREGSELVEYEFPTVYIAFDGPKMTATSKVKNTGNSDFEARYDYEIRSLFGGDPIFPDGAKTALIYPESEFRNDIVWENTPLLGIFNVKYSVTANGSVLREENRVVFVIPAWLLIIMIILLTFLIVWIVLMIKKRHKVNTKMRL